LERPPPPRSTRCPYTTLFRSPGERRHRRDEKALRLHLRGQGRRGQGNPGPQQKEELLLVQERHRDQRSVPEIRRQRHETITKRLDRKSTRLNSSHVSISYAVF